ncbi:MAG: DUF6502 family protein [Lysobacterales bacterium]
MTSSGTSTLRESPGASLLRDSAILTRAVEGVFRKLIRMLIGRMSLKKLQEMIQVIFVEEAEKMLRQENPGKNAALTSLAVIAGYDTRKIVKIKRNDNYLKSFYKKERFLSSLTPECNVLDVWESNPEYLDVQSGKPKPLKISGPAPSFESLIGKSVSARGVTTTSFLQRLEASGSIVVDREMNEVRMIEKRYLPARSKDKAESVKVGMAVIGNLVDTITHNLNVADPDDDLFYQQGCWTNRLRKSDSKKLRQLVRSFLLDSDERARKVIGPFERQEVETDQITAGISMFYFEEESEN